MLSGARTGSPIKRSHEAVATASATPTKAGATRIGVPGRPQTDRAPHEETRRIRSPAGAPLRQADRQAPERVREPAAIHLVEAGHRLAEHAHADDAMAGRGDLLGHLPIGADEHLTDAAAAGGEGVGGELGLHRGEEGLAETVLIAALEELQRGLDGALRR